MLEKSFDLFKSLLLPLYSKGGWRIQIRKNTGHLPASLNCGKSINFQSYQIRNWSNDDVKNVEIRCANQIPMPEEIAVDPDTFTYELNQSKTAIFIPILPVDSTLTVNESGLIHRYYQVFVDGKRVSRNDLRLASFVRVIDDLDWEAFRWVVVLAVLLGGMFFAGKRSGYAQMDEEIDRRARSIASASHRVESIPFLWEFDYKKDVFRWQGVIASHATHCPKVDLLKLNAVKDYEELRQSAKVVACIVSF